MNCRGIFALLLVSFVYWMILQWITHPIGFSTIIHNLLLALPDFFKQVADGVTNFLRKASVFPIQLFA